MSDGHDITIDPPARVRIEQVRGHVRVMVDTDDGTHVLVRIVGYVAQVERYRSYWGFGQLCDTGRTAPTKAKL